MWWEQLPKKKKATNKGLICAGGVVQLPEHGTFTPLVQSTVGLQSCILFSELFVSPSDSSSIPLSVDIIARMGF